MTRGTKVKQERKSTARTTPSRRPSKPKETVDEVVVPIDGEGERQLSRAILVDFGVEGQGPITAAPQGVAVFEIPTLLRRAANELENTLTKASNG